VEFAARMGKRFAFVDERRTLIHPFFFPLEPPLEKGFERKNPFFSTHCRAF
jgi:hypothetical protein